MSTPATALLITTALCTLAILLVVAVGAASAGTAEANRPDARWVAAFRRGAPVAAGFTTALGAVVLLGWILDIAALKSVAPGWVTMKPLTALGFVLGGVALFLLRTSPPVPRPRGAARVAAALTVLIGAGTLAEDLGGWDFGIENRLLPEASVAVQTPHPGRMAPASALNFVLLGTALLWLDARRRIARNAAPYLIFLVLVTALVALASYVYGIEALYSVAPFSSMAMHTALGFLVLGTGALLARPDRGWMAALVSAGPGGVLLRWLVPAAMVLPFLLGWVRLLGQRAGLYSTEFGLAMMVVASSLGFLALASWIAGSLNATDAERVAAQERSERERVFSDFVINNLPGIFYLFDEHGRFRRWNRNFEQVSGYSAQEMETVHPLDFVAEKHRELAWRNILKTLATGRTAHIATDFVARDGTRIPCLFTGLRVEIDGVPHLMGMGLDISDQRRAEDEVRRLNTDLEERVAERTRQLADANRELEAFSYSVSHDLRAPLRAIDGWAHVLAEDYAEALGETGRGLLRRQRDASQQMARLIDDLLRLSRLARHTLVREHIDVADMVKRVWKGIETDEVSRCELTVGDLPRCHADRGLLEQIFVNLLGNARKFSSGRTRARVEVGCRRDAEQAPVYFVRDNGAGFDMRFAAKLFEPFQRLHSAHEFPGVGVGLSIVQRIIHRHGGEIWAEGAVDQGATFFFSLPDGSSIPSETREVAS